MEVKGVGIGNDEERQGIGVPMEQSVSGYIVEIPEVEPEKRHEYCIYKVPQKLRDVNGDAYTPKLISIGPFHHCNENLKKMEELKYRYFRDACDRTNKKKAELVGRIKEIKYEKIFYCYADLEDTDVKEDEFMTMILLDSIFIIEQLWRTVENPPMDPPAMTTISEKCFSMNTFSNSGKVPVLFSILITRRYSLNLKCGKTFERVPCATKLSEAGVEFKVSKSKTRRLLDIQFRKSNLLKICPFLNMSWFLSCFPCFPRFKCLENMHPVLELKSFIIGYETECAVRNLMALEQCHYPREAYICNYIILLDNLINTEADVDLLVEKKVIVNWLGDNKAVATLINKLREQIVEANHSCYGELSKNIQGHYDNVWSKVMASFTTLYFKDFWRGTATVVGIMALFFSFWSFLKPFVFPT
ncbi:uncharacterized protein LOC115985039 [Quercus lobata]|uniref:uncharacterized protein LOC115985039 n=1 Tax=Quercus lobata TaxID=97700 RepID=UPI001244CB24|nr:uncharacterized protein LOC115985039 [Quercus lobata]